MMHVNAKNFNTTTTNIRIHGSLNYMTPVEYRKVLTIHSSCMTLFVAFHNFLRPLFSIAYKTSVQDDLFQDINLMQDK